MRSLDGGPAMSLSESPVKVTPLTPTLGAEVTGIDLTRAQDAETVALLRTAFQKHLVLVIRDQSGLSPDDQVRFCEFFGPLGARSRPADDRREGADAPAEVMFVSNRKEDGRFIGSLPEGEMQFHMDQCYTERPARATCLYAIAVPDEGGDTLFASLCAAYDALPGDLKRIVDDGRARHVFSYDSTNADAVANSADVRECVQPMAVAQPETGRPALYVNRLMTREIVGMAPDAGRGVLDRLIDLVERPEFCYRHKWRVGDLLIWDNLCTVHARTDFDPAADRHLRRFTIAGAPLKPA
ncbi:MAG: TauD/TfdA family dioxygenase [Alphaproteobacteria bacterium]|nr:TauD/TfdA family dioxygenase [Alphaproteobacteria bacterium]